VFLFVGRLFDEGSSCSKLVLKKGLLFVISREAV
jgi:hypothetical protein